MSSPRGDGDSSPSSIATLPTRQDPNTSGGSVVAGDGGRSFADVEGAEGGEMPLSQQSHLQQLQQQREDSGGDLIAEGLGGGFSFSFDRSQGSSDVAPMPLAKAASRAQQHPAHFATQPRGSVESLNDGIAARGNSQRPPPHPPGPGPSHAAPDPRLSSASASSNGSGGAAKLTRRGELLAQVGIAQLPAAPPTHNHNHQQQHAAQSEALTARVKLLEREVDERTGEAERLAQQVEQLSALLDQRARREEKVRSAGASGTLGLAERPSVVKGSGEKWVATPDRLLRLALGCARPRTLPALTRLSLSPHLLAHTILLSGAK